MARLATNTAIWLSVIANSSSDPLLTDPCILEVPPLLYGRCFIPLSGDALLFPGAPCLNFTLPAISRLIGIGAPVLLALLNQACLYKCTQIWIETSTVNLFVVVVPEFVFDSKTTESVVSGDDLE